MSENPFDIFENRPFKAVKLNKLVKTDVKSTTTEEKLLSRIIKTKIKIFEEKKKVREGIFQKIKILSKREISFPMKKYFKFPFELSLINDESAIFTKLRNTFTSALSCAYSNYRKFNETFTVVLFNDIFVFSKELKCTSGSLRLLKSNDIQFTQLQDSIVIEPSDKALVYDVIMNTEIPKGKPLPFILSEFEFDNGIVYRTKIEKEMTVKVANGIEYSYNLTGPLYSSDFDLDEEFNLEYF